MSMVKPRIQRARAGAYLTVMINITEIDDYWWVMTPASRIRDMS
jgi:hypothetical protein